MSVDGEEILGLALENRGCLSLFLRARRAEKKRNFHPKQVHPHARKWLLSSKDQQWMQSTAMPAQDQYCIFRNSNLKEYPQILAEPILRINWRAIEVWEVRAWSSPSLWPSGIGSGLGRNRLWVRFLAVSDIYPMFIEHTITWVPSGFSGYIWHDTKIVFKKVSNQADDFMSSHTMGSQ